MDVEPSGIEDNVQTVVVRGKGRVEAGPARVMRGSALEPGAEVGGRYRIERLLGAGGMARVWLAEDLERKIQVAFKEMTMPALGTPAELEESTLLFRREYFAMKKLQHPGTVKVYDCGLMETGHRYITMEAVSGRDLCDVAKHQPFTCDDVRRMLSRLAQILGFVHARLFVHCDIKAENIRITDAGDVKLMDFGIMHPMGARASQHVWGTPMYMAPEWRDRGIIDARSDLYSLGVLGFTMLTRKVPFATAGAVAGLAMPLPNRPRLLGARPLGRADAAQTLARELAAVADLDPPLAAIVLRLLEPDPKDRYASAAELVAALAAASDEPLADEPLAARASYLQLPVVVGRDRETAELAARLAAALRRESRALLLGAPAGVGKSRLLQELELDAHNEDVPFALGQCRAEGLSPRAPIEQALRALVPSTPAVILDPLRPVLGRLIPSLAAAGAAIPRVFRDASEEKVAVFEALSRWLRELADITPFVLVFEDLHWADSATLETMSVIIRALHRTGGLVIASFRSDELSRLSLAFQTVDEGLADHVELAPLTSAGLTSLVDQALHGLPPGSSLAHDLFAATRGNVFFATECLRALIEQGALTRRLGKWTAVPELAGHPLPRSIQEVVLARLATLSDAQVAFFRRLAPAGRVLDVPLIQAIADVEPQELFQLLDEGVERQFLQYVEGRYFFSHATVHEAIYDHTPAEIRRRCHGRIAAHLVHAAGTRPEAARAIGYHFARSDEPTRAIDPLLRAAARALDGKALLETFQLLEEAAGLLEANPGVPDRDNRLITAWGALIEVAYTSNTPACIRYAQKLFQHWDATVDLARGQAEVRAALAAASAGSPDHRAELLPVLFAEIPLASAVQPREVFLKRAEYRILESIALAITGRIDEFTAGLEATIEDHPPESPYRAAAMVAIGGLTAHTGHFRGVTGELRDHIAMLRGFRGSVATCPRRIEWALGMGAYFLNMNLALMGLPIDDRATGYGFEVADRLGFIDLRVYHVFSQIVRASFTGDGSAFQDPFAEMNELMRKLGNPRLPERNLAIYTPPYYLERGDLALARAVIQRGERLVKLLPGDRWLALYVDVYRACLYAAVYAAGRERDAGAPGPALAPAPAPAPGMTGDGGDPDSGDGGAVPAELVAEATADATEAALAQALAVSRASDFRMESLVLVYQSRFERARGNLEAATRAAEAALARATDLLRANPFDEVLARRALAEVWSGSDGAAQLAQALALAARHHIVLQEAIIRLTLADRTWHTDRRQAARHLNAAEAWFAAARADRWMRRARERRIREAKPGAASEH
ncbi:MAG TPA: AAA family ATPase [Kofleriaceae bacterium]|nr:AAA family ATPase [Kofleriaceae bacterium]